MLSTATYFLFHGCYRKVPQCPSPPIDQHLVATAESRKTEFTVGGIFIVDGAAFGLTTRHSVDKTEISQPLSEQAPTEEPFDGASQPSKSFGLLTNTCSADSDVFPSADLPSNSTTLFSPSIQEQGTIDTSLPLSSEESGLDTNDLASTVANIDATPVNPSLVLDYSRDIQYSL